MHTEIAIAVNVCPFTWVWYPSAPLRHRRYLRGPFFFFFRSWRACFQKLKEQDGARKMKGTACTMLCLLQL